MANDPRDERDPNGQARSDVGGETPETSALQASDLDNQPEDAAPKGRIEELAARFKRPSGSARDQKAGDRVRGAVILAATAVGCLFLFFGLFTTTTDPSKSERRTQPNLGRPDATAASAEAANRSVVPQLNVTQQPSEETGELTEKDLLGTMRNRGTPVPTENVPKPAPKRTATRPALNSINFDDPALAEAYRRQGLTPPPQRPTEVTDWNAAIAEYQAKQAAKSAPTVPTPPASEALRKSSFVYVRTNLGNVANPPQAVPAIQPSLPARLLPQGTKLVARLQFAVSSAAKAPVVAVIEYNYERDGELIVPAGTKAYGTLSQATPQGWVSLNFDALEFPNGEQEKINGSALGMDQEVLKGVVNGRNTGKKFLTRAVTGIGTIAAFAVGGRGLGGQIDNSILLRERLSSNVAMAGEQQLAMLAYQQNIVVTVPANTRFYLVLNEAGVSTPTLQDTQVPGSRGLANGAELRTIGATPPAAPLAGMSPQELQELIAIRNEMREMNRLIKIQNLPANAPSEPEK